MVPSVLTCDIVDQFPSLAIGTVSHQGDTFASRFYYINIMPASLVILSPAILA